MRAERPEPGHWLSSSWVQEAVDQDIGLWPVVLLLAQLVSGTTTSAPHLTPRGTPAVGMGARCSPTSRRRWDRHPALPRSPLLRLQFTLESRARGHFAIAPETQVHARLIRSLQLRAGYCRCRRRFGL